MKRAMMLAALIGMLLAAANRAEDPAPLVLEAKVPLGAVAGRIDHFAFDPDEHRLLVAFRSPAKLMVFATRTGKLEGSFDTCRDADDVFVDPQRRRLYGSCGEGVID